MEGMDGNRPFPYNGDTPSTPTQQEETTERINIEQLQRLVQMLDTSDVSEIELKRAGDGVHGMRLVLRKAKVTADSERNGQQVLVTTTSSREMEQATPTEPTLHNVVAPLVGIFHSWARVKGGSLVAVGDRVKAGQLVATIRSLNVLNEVESPIAGRVTELLVQDGQAVEYGQPLMVIDNKEGA